MLNSGATSCCQNSQQAAGMPIYGVPEEIIPPNLDTNSVNQPTNSSSFFYNLSLLSDKVQQVESLASMFLAPDNNPQLGTMAVAIPAMESLIQEIIITASSMMFSCQQMSKGSTSTTGQADGMPVGSRVADDPVHVSYYSDHHRGMMDQWCGEDYNNCNSSNIDGRGHVDFSLGNEVGETKLKGTTQGVGMSKNCEIIQLDAAGLLAKYTHYCHVCGKGFKRDANLRMHMRAHGEEYKSIAALCNPMKNHGADASGGDDNRTNSSSMIRLPKKYSCPQDGCRWNKNHAKFQPLKSMICVKNHYKRSHCPKMYMCKRCHKKNFSVLSDLRTHEKHCGDLKWQCSCGTTFSRKDKLMGHVVLFVGHVPAVNSTTKNELEARYLNANESKVTF